jgi:transposase InsO family protein
MEYINFRLTNADANGPAVFTAAETLETKFLLYLVEGEHARLVIPKNLHQMFLQLAHDRNNHAGIDRTYQRLRQHYFIKGMAKVVKDYVSHCPSCLINKPPKFAPTGKLQPIRPAANPWDLVTMDFIVKLPAAKMKRGKWQSAVFDSVLTITDKLTRYIWLVPGREDWSAKEWAEAYFAEVYPTMGIPGAIITDRGSVFVSYMWTTLFSLLGTDCMATTAYNPEADGQSERTNQTVEIALRHLVNDWARRLD